MALIGGRNEWTGRMEQESTQSSELKLNPICSVTLVKHAILVSHFKTHQGCRLQNDFSYCPIQHQAVCGIQGDKANNLSACSESQLLSSALFKDSNVLSSRIMTQDHGRVCCGFGLQTSSSSRKTSIADTVAFV